MVEFVLKYVHFWYTHEHLNTDSSLGHCLWIGTPNFSSQLFHNECGKLGHSDTKIRILFFSLNSNQVYFCK